MTSNSGGIGVDPDWFFPPLGGGEESGLNDPGIETFKKAERLAREDIFWFMPGYLPGRQAPANVIRSGDWKLIENFEDGTLELFNLRDDIGETGDLTSEQPDRATELHGRLKRWREETGAKVPDRNPAFDPQNEGKW